LGCAGASAGRISPPATRVAMDYPVRIENGVRKDYLAEMVVTVKIASAPFSQRFEFPSGIIPKIGFGNSAPKIFTLVALEQRHQGCP